MQRREYGEFFAIEAAEVNVFVEAMYGEKNGAGLELGDCANAFAFVAFVERVAGDSEIVGILAHLEQQFIHGIAQSEQADVRLQPQAQLGGIHAREILWLERWLPETVECLDIGPFQARHVQGEMLALPGQYGMLWQPVHQARTSRPGHGALGMGRYRGIPSAPCPGRD